MSSNRYGGCVLVAGSANADFVIRASHIPAPGETVLGEDMAIVAGGKGANQAVACARAGGAPTAMLVALGQDASGAMLERSLREAGVELHIVRTDRSTGAAMITVSADAENAITVAPGANEALAEADLPDLAGVSWLVLQLETPLETVACYARAARSAGVKVLLNAAPARAIPTDLVAAIDVLVVNEAELAAIVGAEGSLADQLQRVGVPLAIVTLGARGCCAWSDDRFHLQPPYAVDAVDTTAAGDTFVGVLAAALARGMDLADAMRWSAAAGALAATRPGAQSSIPDAAVVAGLISNGSLHDARGLAHYCGIDADHE